MKKAPEKQKNVASQDSADDFDLSTVAMVAAVIKNGDHDLSSNTAAIQALTLLDECRKELDKRRQPKTGSIIPYEDAVRRITGREETRLDRIDEAFRKFVTANPSMVHGLKHSALFIPANSEAFESEATAEDINQILEYRKTHGFPDEQIDSLKTAYSRWKNRRVSGRRKKK